VYINKRRNHRAVRVMFALICFCMFVVFVYTLLHYPCHLNCHLMLLQQVTFYMLIIYEIIMVYTISAYVTSTTYTRRKCDDITLTRVNRSTNTALNKNNTISIICSNNISITNPKMQHHLKSTTKSNNSYS